MNSLKHTSEVLVTGTQRFFRRVSVPQHGVVASFVDLTNLEAFEAALQKNTRVSNLSEKCFLHALKYASAAIDSHLNNSFL